MKLIVVVPLTVAPFDGLLMETVGGVVSELWYVIVTVRAYDPEPL